MDDDDYTETFLLKERKRTDAIVKKESKETIPVIPRTLNPRASMLLASNPRTGTHSPPLQPSPRTRSPSLGMARPAEEKRQLRRQSRETCSTDEDEEDAAAYKALQTEKESINKTLRVSNNTQRKMVSGDLTFFEQPTNESPEVARMKENLRRVEEQMTFMLKQQYEINQYLLEVKQQRDEERAAASRGWCF